MLMRPLLCTLTILTLVAFSLAQSGKSKDSPRINPSDDGKELIEGKVVSVENGDTIIVQVPGEIPYTYLVKLQAVDAPDIGQPYFDNSRNGLSKLVYKKQVKVFVNTMYAKGMVIGTVFRDGRDVGLGMLEKGLAWHFKRFAYQQPSSDRKSYADAQDYASSAGLGLWSENRPTPPWIFRGETTQNTAASPGSSNTVSPANSVHKESAAIGSVPPSAANRPESSETGRKYILGPRGGCYYVSSSGGKVYVKDKSRCGVTLSETRP